MAYKAQASATGSSTAPAATLGGAPAENDIIIWFCDCDGPTRTITVPTGFTAFGSSGSLSGPDAQSYQGGWKRAGASEGTTYTGTIGSSNEWFCGIMTFDGRHTTNPPVIGVITNNTASNASPVSVTAPGVTAVAGDDLAMLVYPDTTATTASHNFSASPSGMTERIDKFGAGFMGGGGFSQDNVSAGATGDKTATLTLISGNSGWAACLVRIPAAAGSATAVYVPLIRSFALTRANRY